MIDATTNFKKLAGTHAATLVESGMVVGLGTGSTAIFAIRAIAERLRDGTLLQISAVATSRITDAAARTLGIPMLTDDIPREIDITIDGADEVDRHFDLIKGGGGALLHEKIVAQASRRMVIVVDETKLSPRLGTHHSLPMEALAFGWHSQVRYLENLGATVTPRTDDTRLFRTDEGNLILDAQFGPIADPTALADQLSQRAGIVEHGLFIGIATDLIVAGAHGVRHLRRGEDPVSA